MDKKSIGNSIKQIRELYKVSNYDIERQTNINHSLLYRYENGKIEPTIINLIKIANFYNISLDELVGRDFISKY